MEKRKIHYHVILFSSNQCGLKLFLLFRKLISRNFHDKTLSAKLNFHIVSTIANRLHFSLILISPFPISRKIYIFTKKKKINKIRIFTSQCAKYSNVPYPSSSNFTISKGPFTFGPLSISLKFNYYLPTLSPPGVPQHQPCWWRLGRPTAWALTEASCPAPASQQRPHQAPAFNMNRTCLRCPRRRSAVTKTHKSSRSRGLDSLNNSCKNSWFIPSSLRPRLQVRLSSCWASLLVLLSVLAEMTGEAVSSAAVGATAASGHHYQVRSWVNKQLQLK